MGGQSARLPGQGVLGTSSRLHSSLLSITDKETAHWEWVLVKKSHGKWTACDVHFDNLHFIGGRSFSGLSFKPVCLHPVSGLWLICGSKLEVVLSNYFPCCLPCYLNRGCAAVHQQVWGSTCATVILRAVVNQALLQRLDTNASQSQSNQFCLCICFEIACYCSIFSSRIQMGLYCRPNMLNNIALSAVRLICCYHFRWTSVLPFQ